MAVRHLALLGHRDIVMISGCIDDPIGRDTTLARQAGFRAGMREAGFRERPGDIITEPWGVDGGRRAMERLLAGRQLPTAIFAESDETAFGVLQTLRRVGLDVPGAVSVMGFDDHELAQASDLTSIAQPVHEQGRLGARMILDMVARPLIGAAAPAGDVVVLPTRLVVRGTTGPPRRDG